MTTPEKIGKYQITGKLGQGAMGEVFRALDPVLNREVAIKRISAGLDADETMRKRFQREAQAVALLSHPHIITVYELGFENDMMFMAMELLEGKDLKYAIANRKMSLDEKLSLMEQIGRGPRLRTRSRHRAPRPEARQHPHPAGRQGEDHGLRAGPHGRLRHDQHRHRDGHAALHVARAGARPEGRRALRRLRARLHLLRAARRQEAVRRRVDARRAVQGDAGGAAGAARARRRTCRRC